MFIDEIIRHKVTSGSGSREESELNEIVIPQDQAVASKNGSQEEIAEIVSSPHDQAGTKRVNLPTDSGPNDIVRDTVASKRGSSEEKNHENVTNPPQGQKADDVKKRDENLKKLHRVVWKWNELSKAVDIIKEYPEFVRERISQGGTVLHVAAATEYSTEFVKFLVDRMRQEDLTIKNDDGDTAFCLVAASGNQKIAEIMLKRNPSLVMIPGRKEMIPLEIAARFSHRKMVDWLFQYTPVHLDDKALLALLFRLIETGFHDVSLKLVEQYRKLATDRDGNGETALHVLARTPMTSSNIANQKEQGILKRCFNLFLCSNHCKKELHQQSLELVNHLWNQVKTDWNDISIPKAIFVAAAQGNVDFLTIIIRDYPEFILKVNENKHSIFHVAVLNRQKKIFELIYKISPSHRSSILQYKDKKENNILQLAGMLLPSDRLNTVSGVALQLQQELLWFEEVRELMHPSDVEQKNKKKKTPRALFTERHEKLKEKGEEWMKETANSCMIVATLIATVVFAAAFTIPGGTKDETGTPNFIQKVSFTAFVISDAVSLVSSAGSILTFLSILTSRYAEKDFLTVLPRKLFFGLSTLLLSIAAMMVVFSATIFIVYKDGMVWIPILVSVIASLPVILFTKQQWRLLFDVWCSTFKTSSRFRSSKRTLFDDEVKKKKPNKLVYYAFLCILIVYILVSCVKSCCCCLLGRRKLPTSDVAAGEKNTSTSDAAAGEKNISTSDSAEGKNLSTTDVDEVKKNEA